MSSKFSSLLYYLLFYAGGILIHQCRYPNHRDRVSFPMSCAAIPASSISGLSDFLSDGPVSEVFHCNSGIVHQWIARFPVGRSCFRGFALQFRHRPSVYCPIPCRTVLFPRFCTAIPAPSISELPDSLSDASGFLVQKHYFGIVHQWIVRFPVGRSCFRGFSLQFRHRPSVDCPIPCRTLPVSLFRITISAPSISELPDFLSDTTSGEGTQLRELRQGSRSMLCADSESISCSELLKSMRRHILFPVIPNK